MIDICIPGERCEWCPMNSIPPDEQFPVQFEASTNRVNIKLIGEDAGVFNVDDRFALKSLIGQQVDFTVRGGLCGQAVGAQEDVVAEIIDEELEGVVERLRCSVPETVQLTLEVDFEDEGMTSLQAEAMSSVIVRFAQSMGE